MDTGVLILQVDLLQILLIKGFFDLLSEDMKNEVVKDLSNITNNETNKENFKNQTLVRKIDKENTTQKV